MAIGTVRGYARLAGSVACDEPGTVRWCITRVARPDHRSGRLPRRRQAGEVCADPHLYEVLWFADGEANFYPPFDVPPESFKWSADRRTVTVERREYAPEELKPWIERGKARPPT